MYDVNNIWTYNSDGTVYGDFFYLNKWTEADIMTLWVEPDMEYLKDRILPLRRKTDL